MIHELKIEPEYLAGISNGSKTFEIRKNDRNFQRGDYLALNEWRVYGRVDNSQNTLCVFRLPVLQGRICCNVNQAL